MQLKWTEILSTDREALNHAAEIRSIHPLALEDCLHRDQRPKLDDYENHKFLVWFLLTREKVYEIQFLIFTDEIIVVTHDGAPDGTLWRDYLKLTQPHRDVWHMLYQALDRATDITWQDIRAICSYVDELEQEIFKKDFNPQELIAVKKQLNQIDDSIGHLASVAKQILNLTQPTDDLKWKLRDLQDHCERIYRSIALYRSQISSVVEMYWGLQANRTDRQIKKLSILASVSVPLTFWTSFWGMNFDFIPFESTALFFGALSLMGISVAVTSFLLIRKGYWND